MRRQRAKANADAKASLSITHFPLTVAGCTDGAGAGAGAGARKDNACRKDAAPGAKGQVLLLLLLPHRTLPMEMPVNECAICDVGGYQTCAGVGGRRVGVALQSADEQPWPWRLDVAGRGFACWSREGQGEALLDQRNSLKHKRDDNNV